MIFPANIYIANRPRGGVPRDIMQSMDFVGYPAPDNTVDVQKNRWNNEIGKMSTRRAVYLANELVMCRLNKMLVGGFFEPHDEDQEDQGDQGDIDGFPVGNIA